MPVLVGSGRNPRWDFPVWIWAVDHASALTTSSFRPGHRLGDVFRWCGLVGSAVRARAVGIGTAGRCFVFLMGMSYLVGLHISYDVIWNRRIGQVSRCGWEKIPCIRETIERRILYSLLTCASPLLPPLPLLSLLPLLRPSLSQRHDHLRCLLGTWLL